MNPEPEQLALVVRRSAAAKAFFQLVVEQPRLRREALVDSILDRTGQERREIVKVLRDLEACRAGRLIVGRRKQKTRFAWSDQFDVLATVKKALLLESMRPGEARVASEAPPAGASNAETIQHRFMLRPSAEVEFTLPQDLTQREADRLADFIKTLPFDRSR